LLSALKYPVTILLIIVISLQTFSKCFVILGYEINKDYISKNLCENRAKPSCCCHGSCYLKKKLAKEETGQRTGKDGQREVIQIQWVSQDSPNMEFFSLSICKPDNLFYLIGKSQEFSLSFFQPPQCWHPFFFSVIYD
jgi:hypothetical protein